MQSHKKPIEKRVYKAGEVIEIPTVKLIKKGIYRAYKNIKRSFKINQVDGNTLYGEYLSD